MIEESSGKIGLTRKPHGHARTISDIMSRPDETGNKPTEQGARDKLARYFIESRRTPEGRAFLKQTRNLQKEERLKLEEAKKLSLIDPLTGLFNRRHLDGNEDKGDIGELERKFKEAERASLDLSALMIDIDNFKDFNDKYGHDTGDKILKNVSSMIMQICRKSDILFRYGGEEFLILAPETNIDGAQGLAERINDAVKNIPKFKHEVTVSIGIATYHNSEKLKDKVFSTSIDTKEDLIKKADLAMYWSKRHGKDQATIANNMNSEQITEMSMEKVKDKLNNNMDDTSYYSNNG